MRHIWFREILVFLFLSTVCVGQGFIQTPPPYWYVVAPPGALASRPVTCTPNFHVYVCNGAGCTTNGEYHYCTALNTWTVASGALGGPPTGSAGGKLSGTYPNPGLNAASTDLTDSAGLVRGGAAIPATPYLLPVASGVAGSLGISTLKLNAGVLYPTADSTTAIQVNKADGSTVLFSVDTTNKQIVFENGVGIQAKVSGGAAVSVLSPWSDNNFYIGPPSTFGLTVVRAATSLTLNPGNVEKARIDAAGNFALGTTSPIGKLQAVISATSPVIFGGATVASYTTVTSPTLNKNYLNKTGIGTANAVGNLAVVTAGTDVYLGMFRVILIVTADSIQVDRAIHASGADVTDISVSTSTAYNEAIGTNRAYWAGNLAAATGNEVAFRFDYTTNKAAGNDTGLQINMTDALSPGTSLPFQINVGGVQKLAVDNVGNITAGTYIGMNGLTSGDVRLNRNGASLEAKLGDDSAYATFRASVLSTYNGTYSLVLNAAQQRLGLPSGASIKWSTDAYTGDTATHDSGISRPATGTLAITSGTAGKPGGLQAGSIAMQSLAVITPTSVTPQGTGGAHTWTYVGQSCLADGVTCSGISATVSTTVGNATLTGTNSNRILWDAVTGATSYIWRRTVSGGTPATLGAFACTAVTATSCDDVGAAGDTVAGPATNATGVIQANYKALDGTFGFTGTACTAYKNGLCVSGT